MSVIEVFWPWAPIYLMGKERTQRYLLTVLDRYWTDQFICRFASDYALLCFGHQISAFRKHYVAGAGLAEECAAQAMQCVPIHQHTIVCSGDRNVSPSRKPTEREKEHSCCFPELKVNTCSRLSFSEPQKRADVCNFKMLIGIFRD